MTSLANLSGLDGVRPLLRLEGATVLAAAAFACAHAGQSPGLWCKLLLQVGYDDGRTG